MAIVLGNIIADIYYVYAGDEEIKETDMFSIPYEGHRKKDQRYLNDRNSSIDPKYHADLYDGHDQ